MRSLLISFAASAAFTLWLVHASKGAEGRSLDNNFSQPQKVHSVAVPRIGGVGIAAGLVCGVVSLLLTQNLAAVELGLLLLLCGLPAFGVGLLHDYTDTIAPRGRLLATAVSAVLAFYVLDAAIRVTDIPGLDWVAGTAAGALGLTVLAVAGISNAINIIDGLNGLAAMCVAIMLAAISYVAFEVGDPFVGTMALVVLGAVLGFFLWNFPAGLIFLGDGGAYLLGFLLAEVSILLLVRNPEVSPLFPLLVCIYPVFETLFSIYRRYWLRASPASMPDGIHLHSLVYRRLMRWAVGNRSAKALTRRNSMTSPYLWLLCSASVVPALLFWNNSGAIACFLVLFGLSYSLLYRRIVRFKSPRWLRVSASRPVPLSTRDNQET